MRETETERGGEEKRVGRERVEVRRGKWSSEGYREKDR